MPVPKEHEVLIKIEYSALNRADIMQVSFLLIYLFQRNGAYPPPLGASPIIGLECVGYIIKDLENDLKDENYK